MGYKRIKTRKIYEEVAEALIEMIRQGELKPGDKIDSVTQLAESFEVGRSAVREALSALRAMGLVEIHQGEGTYIREFEPSLLQIPLSMAVLMKKEDIINLLEVRKFLEVGAVGAAAFKRTNEDLRLMNEALKSMERTIGNEELGEKSDLQFHIAVANASHNDLLVGLMNNVSEIMIETMRETRRLWLYSQQTTSERLLQEHEKIYQAIADQDSKRAQDLMFNHLDKVEEVLTKYINENQDD